MNSKFYFKIFVLASACLLHLASYAQTNTAPANGDGTEDNPYQIESLDNLYWMSQNISEEFKYYIQTADIDASPCKSWNNGKGFSPIGTKDAKFYGRYNGQGFIIENLYMNYPEDEYIALFGICKGNTYLKNIGLINVDITGSDYVAPLLGYGEYQSVLVNCFCTGDVVAKTGGKSAGGLACDFNGYAYYCSSFVNVYIDPAYSTGGGLFNEFRGTLISCYARGKVDVCRNSGG